MHTGVPATRFNILLIFDDHCISPIPCYMKYMAKMEKDEWCSCPFRYAVTAFVDKWSLLILRDMNFLGRKRYSEFLKAEEGISTNILADRLDRLVTQTILEKQPDIENPGKQIYVLTKKGRDLLPILLDIVRWSHKWDQDTVVEDEFIAEINDNPVKFVADFYDKGMMNVCPEEDHICTGTV